MNSREFGRSLETLSTDMKQEIANLKIDIRTAKGLKTNLEKLFRQSEDLIAKLTDSDTGVEAYYANTIETKAKVDEANVSAQAAVTAINAALESAQSSLTEVENAYEAFIELKGKVNDPDTGMKALYERVSAIEAEINVSKDNAEANLSLIATILTRAQTNVEEMEAAYEAFTEINEKISDEDEGLRALLASSTELKSEISAVKTNAETLFKDIRKFRDEAANYIKEISGLKTTAASTVSEIKTHHTESLVLKEQIEQIFHIGSRGAQADHFAKRRNQLFWISFAWLILFLVFLSISGTLAIILILPIVEVLKNPTITVSLELLIIRAVILSPFIFGAIYSLVQYTSERRLYEKYAFKTITTFSVETSVQTLKRVLENIPDDLKNQRVVDFAIDIFEKLYQEPIEFKTDKWVFRGGNKLLQITGELNQSIGDIQKDVDKIADSISKDTD